MKRHLGSTIALIVGMGSFFSAFSPTGYLGSGIAGIIIILGASAYRSAKKRKIGEVKSSIIRYSMEILSIGLITLFFIICLIRFPDAIVDHPVPLFLVPLWTIIAYLVANLSRTKWIIYADREEKIKP